MKAKATFDSVEEYIALQPGEIQPLLRAVRKAIQKGIPDAEETISYKIPAYKVHGRAALYFAGWKQHYSLYPAKDEVVAKFKNELARYQISKGTIRFPLSEPVPEKLIERIARFRAKELAAASPA